MDVRNKTRQRTCCRIVTAALVVVLFAGGLGAFAAAGVPATRPAGQAIPAKCKLLVREGERPDINTPIVDRHPVFRACFDAKGTRLLAAMPDEVRVYDVPAMTPAAKPL